MRPRASTYSTGNSSTHQSESKLRYFVISPEVAGYLGPNSELDRGVVPPRVLSLHYVIEGWLGDPILESHPAFLIEESLGNELARLGSTGMGLANAWVTRSEQSIELDPDLRLPTFRWLQVPGRPGVDDFAADALGRLVVSEPVLATLRNAGMRNAVVEDYER